MSLAPSARSTFRLLAGRASMAAPSMTHTVGAAQKARAGSSAPVAVAARRSEKGDDSGLKVSLSYHMRVVV